jgi:branched-chain amino acid aminotransferase
MSIFFTYNGKFYKEGTAVITPDSRALKYGDGLFETIKLEKGKLLLKEYHFERLFNGMQILTFEFPHAFTANFIENKILELAKKNHHLSTARIRLTIFRGNGTLTENKNNLPGYIIQTWALHDDSLLNHKGLSLGIFTSVKKSCDMLANIKTNNFLPYALAAMFAKNNNLSDCILLNTHNNICDTSIANIFIIKEKKIYTPPLSEGCIAGVIRRLLIEEMISKNDAITEKPLSIEDVEQADEIFLTNSINPVRWVSQFQNHHYTNMQVQLLYNKLQNFFNN